MDKQDIERVIAGCKKGKRQSQQELFNLFSEELFGVCLYYSKDYADAEDLLHDGFMKIFKNISQFRHEGSIQGWMRKVVVNTALEKYRKKNILYAVGDDFDFEKEFEPVNLNDEVTVGDLMGFIRQLSPKYRLVFNLYAIEGYSHREISGMLGISEGTSKSNLARARAILQKKVEKYYYGKSVNNG
ncbi:MAG: RNA polymerase sigma factor [Bacteroidales bacterium]|nr:RNA polymerase sigma factor [Bacteroidales bacterium]